MGSHACIAHLMSSVSVSSPNEDRADFGGGRQCAQKRGGGQWISVLRVKSHPSLRTRTRTHLHFVPISSASSLPLSGWMVSGVRTVRRFGTLHTNHAYVFCCSLEPFHSFRELTFQNTMKLTHRDRKICANMVLFWQLLQH